MTARMIRLSAIATLVVAVVLVRGVYPASAENLRRIVVFREGTAVTAQQKVVKDSGSQFLRALTIINAASIELPAVNADAALSYLKAQPSVLRVYIDPEIRGNGVDAIGTGAGGDGAGGDGAGGDGNFVSPAPTPTKELYPWGVSRIGADDAQQGRPRTLGGGVVVAILDTGIDRKHPELADAVVGGFNAIAPSPFNAKNYSPDDYNDDNGHGTAMAGIVAARKNGRGVIGVAPRARLFVVKVLDNQAKGHTSDTIFALGEIMARPEIRVISMSYSTSLPVERGVDLYNLLYDDLHTAVLKVIASGKVFVASRGNRSALCDHYLAQMHALGIDTGANGAGGDGAGGDGAGGDGAGGDGAGGDGAGGDIVGAFEQACGHYPDKWPAIFPEVISVGASTFDNTSPDYALPNDIDVVAPGGEPVSATDPGAIPILTTNRGGGYGYVAGTSPAAAHVSGAVALILARRHKLTAAQVQTLLMKTAVPLHGVDATLQGAGLINVRAALDELRKARREKEDVNDNDDD